MRLHAVDIPDDSARLPAWLEQHLVGPQLGALVAELAAVHAPAPGPAPSLHDVLGPHEAAVLRDGLAVLPPAALRQLLVRPRLLLDLQELVLTAGGPYWEGVGGASPELDAAAERGRLRVAEFLAADEGAPQAVPRARLPIPWYRRPWLVSAATAAAVLLAVLGYRLARPPAPPPAPSGWGWNRPGALPQDVPASVYLNRLADAAAEWFAERPDDPAAVAKRIGQFRAGCSVLIFAEHRPLSDADRQWLVERCRAWADKLDKQLEALEAGQDPVQVRAETDETVTKLIGALRARAGG